jgi:hypothetical protein
MAQHPRRQSSSYSPPRKTEIIPNFKFATKSLKGNFESHEGLHMNVALEDRGLHRVIQKEVYTFKNYFTITTEAKSMSCVRMERKSLKVLILISSQVPGVHTTIMYAKGCFVQNGGKRTGESFLRAGIRQDNVSVKCATTFLDTLWKESANQEVYLRLVQVWEELGC